MTARVTRRSLIEKSQNILCMHVVNSYNHLVVRLGACSVLHDELPRGCARLNLYYDTLNIHTSIRVPRLAYAILHYSFSDGNSLR